MLVEADFLHRSGQFRRVGRRRARRLLVAPSGTILYHGAEADLRDVAARDAPAFLDASRGEGGRSRVASIRDDFSAMAREGRTYRVEDVHAGEGRIVVGESSEPGATDRIRLIVDDRSRIMKDDRVVGLGDLAVGDELLVNRFDESHLRRGVGRRRGPEGRDRDAAGIRRDFLRRRGLAARIDRVEGKRLTVTLLGDRGEPRRADEDRGIDPAKWASEGRFVDTVVANEELRTYNPPVDRKRAKVISYEALPPGPVGCGGVRWVIEPDLLLEGFRKGRSSACLRIRRGPSRTCRSAKPSTARLPTPGPTASTRTSIPTAPIRERAPPLVPAEARRVPAVPLTSRDHRRTAERGRGRPLRAGSAPIARARSSPSRCPPWLGPTSWASRPTSATSRPARVAGS